MFLCMRTTVDLPDGLLRRVKRRLAERKMTFRSLVISALEQTLAEDSQSFTLRDASIGNPDDTLVSNAAINDAIDAQRNPRFGP